MKKFLSMVMALAMTLTLVTVGASAKTFTDDSTVSYKEAVSVVSGIGVVDGYTDGSFNPSATLTRGAAAKIICNMILGPTTAGALGVNAAPFKDVPVSNVFAGYIAYCSQQGIINGYSDGTFKPSATVTGYQFMKMLLGALGYDGSIEGFTGSNWTVAVAKLAVSIGLDNGNDSFVGSKAMTRQEACLYAFNTLLADMVEYSDKGSSISVGGVVISTGSSSAETVYATGATSIKTGTPNTAGQYTQQFAEKYFPKLILTTDEYAEGRTGRSFAYKGTTLCSFGATDDLLATSTNGTSFANLTDKSNSHYIGYAADTTVTYLYQDGAAEAGTTTLGTGYPTVSTGTAITLATQNAAIQAYAATKGVIVNFLDTDGNGKYDVVSVINESVCKLSAAPKTSTSGSVTKVTINGIFTSKDSDDVSYPDGLAKDDVVLYYASQNGTTYVYNTTNVTGTLTASTSSKVTVDGSSYSLSGLSGNNVSSITNSASKSGSTFYLDNGGNVCYYKTASDAVNLDNTLFVVNATNSGYVYQAKVVYMDGTTGIITVDKTSANGGTMSDVAYTTDNNSNSVVDSGELIANYFYTFSKNSDGNYNLTACTNQGTATNVAKGQATYAVTGTNGTSSTSAYANSTTAFVLKKNTGSSYACYTGVANTAKYTGTAYTLFDTDKNILAVITLSGTLDNSSVSSYDVVLPVSGPVTVYKTDGSVDYYTFEAIVNGEHVDAFKTASSSTLTLGVPALVNGYDGENANSLETAVVNMQPVTTGVGDEISVSNSTMIVESSGTVKGAVALASDAQFVVYDVADKTVEVMDPADMTAETGHNYVVKTVATSDTNSAVKYVFVDDYSATVPTLSAYTMSDAGTLTVTPSVAYPTVTVASSDTSVATVGISSNTITVTKVATGTCNVTVTCTPASGTPVVYVVPVTVQ